MLQCDRFVSSHLNFPNAIGLSRFAECSNVISLSCHRMRLVYILSPNAPMRLVHLSPNAPMRLVHPFISSRRVLQAEMKNAKNKGLRRVAFRLSDFKEPTQVLQMRVDRKKHISPKEGWGQASDSLLLGCCPMSMNPVLGLQGEKLPKICDDCSIGHTKWPGLCWGCIRSAAQGDVRHACSQLQVLLCLHVYCCTFFL